MDKREYKEAVKVDVARDKYANYYLGLEEIKTGAKWGAIVGAIVGLVFSVYAIGFSNEYTFIEKIVPIVLSSLMCAAMLAGTFAGWKIAPYIYFLFELIIPRAIFAATIGGGMWPIALITLYYYLQYKRYEKSAFIKD